jgi:hypothetical protein
VDRVKVYKIIRTTSTDALSAPLARATPQAICYGRAKRVRHDAALTIVGLPCAECRYRSDACSKIRRNDLGT